MVLANQDPMNISKASYRCGDINHGGYTHREMQPLLPLTTALGAYQPSTGGLQCAVSKMLHEKENDNDAQTNGCSVKNHWMTISAGANQRLHTLE